MNLTLRLEVYLFDHYNYDLNVNSFFIITKMSSALNNKIDVLLENDDVINYYVSLEPNLKDQLVKIKSFDQKIGFYISFPNTEEGRKYLSLFENGFKKLSSNDGYEILELRKKYGLNK